MERGCVVHIVIYLDNHYPEIFFSQKMQTIGKHGGTQKTIHLENRSNSTLAFMTIFVMLLKIYVCKNSRFSCNRC